MTGILATLAAAWLVLALPAAVAIGTVMRWASSRPRAISLDELDERTAPPPTFVAGHWVAMSRARSGR